MTRSRSSADAGPAVGRRPRRRLAAALLMGVAPTSPDSSAPHQANRTALVVGLTSASSSAVCRMPADPVALSLM
ncbi:hypothetical protein, partial [Modestobacter sp. KNN46-3]|uniref:hypothetical protein n=1 Tax=Modestobacter sp. KNN46-3 TaxID=2711218 RepID=UPI0019D1B8E6